MTESTQTPREIIVEQRAKLIEVMAGLEAAGCERKHFDREIFDELRRCGIDNSGFEKGLSCIRYEEAKELLRRRQSWGAGIDHDKIRYWLNPNYCDTCAAITLVQRASSRIATSHCEHVLVDNGPGKMKHCEKCNHYLPEVD